MSLCGRSDIEVDLLRLPPSPPPSPSHKRAAISTVDRLTGILRLHCSGRRPSSDDWRVFSLSSAQFAELETRVAADDALSGYFYHKVRWDYAPDEATFILRMPTTTHERFISLVEDAIIDEFCQLATRLDARHEPEAAAALRDIYKGRSPTLELHPPRLDNSSQSSFSSSSEDVTVRRSPDATFFHRQHNALPALVVEVSYSQQRKELSGLAESYIIDSAHHIRCVLGLDITYRGKSKDRSASLSIWRPGTDTDEDGEEIGICRCDADAQLFQTAEGDACDGDMTLSVADILPAVVLDTLPMSLHAESIAISFARLRAFLHDAEIKQGVQRSKDAQKRFRKKKRTRSEQLEDDREASYLKQEQLELEKERKADGEWRPDTSPIPATGLEDAAAELVVRRSKRNKTGRSEDGS